MYLENRLNNLKVLLASVLGMVAFAAHADHPLTTISVEPVDAATEPTIVGVATALSGGAWVGNGVGPTILSKNFQYKLTINPVGTIPNPAPITVVNFSWGLSYKPAGLEVLLCKGTTTSSCINVTSLGTGSTAAWAGSSANTPFTFAFKVTGTGSMQPAFGQSDQVIVNWN